MKTYVMNAQSVESVEIVADVKEGQGTLKVLGLPNEGAAREVAVRVSAALSSIGVYAHGRVTFSSGRVALARSVPELDLAVAVEVLWVLGKVNRTSGVTFFAELGLDGKLRPVRGAYATIVEGHHDLVVTALDCRAEVEHATQAPVVGAWGLEEVVKILKHRESRDLDVKLAPTPDIAWVEDEGSRQVEEAAERGESILLVGRPGSGKTLLARIYRSFLDETKAPAKEIWKVHSLAGTLTIPMQLPFRAPHHSVSEGGLCGSAFSPGEVSLAHGGVLFLDELIEFRRASIERLASCLRDGVALWHCSGITVAYPARPHVVCSAMPCPCGKAGTSDCRCPRESVERYELRLQELATLLNLRTIRI